MLWQLFYLSWPAALQDGFLGDGGSDPQRQDRLLWLCCLGRVSSLLCCCPQSGGVLQAWMIGVILQFVRPIINGDISQLPTHSWVSSWCPLKNKEFVKNSKIFRDKEYIYVVWQVSEGNSFVSLINKESHFIRRGLWYKLTLTFLIPD